MLTAIQFADNPVPGASSERLPGRGFPCSCRFAILAAWHCRAEASLEVHGIENAVLGGVGKSDPRPKAYRAQSSEVKRREPRRLHNASTRQQPPGTFSPPRQDSRRFLRRIPFHRRTIGLERVCGEVYRGALGPPRRGLRRWGGYAPPGRRGENRTNFAPSSPAFPSARLDTHPPPPMKSSPSSASFWAGMWR